jgi:hypothetical protein
VIELYFYCFKTEEIRHYIVKEECTIHRGQLRVTVRAGHTSC